MNSFLRQEFKKISNIAKDSFEYASRLSLLMMMYDSKVITLDQYLSLKKRLNSVYKNRKK